MSAQLRKRWHKSGAFAGGIWRWRRGIWRSTARCWRRCSADEDFRPIISRRSDILEQPVLTLLLSAVDAVTGGFEYEDVFRCLKTGMTSLTAEECDLLENYVIRWEIRGNMWLRDADWTADPDGYSGEMTDYRREQLAEINAVQKKSQKTVSYPE